MFAEARADKRYDALCVKMNEMHWHMEIPLTMIDQDHVLYVRPVERALQC